MMSPAGSQRYLATYPYRPRRRVVVFFRALHITVIVPITHYIVRAATVHNACQVAHVLNEVHVLNEGTEEREIWRKFCMVDVTVQGLVQSKHELGHDLFLPHL